MGCRLLLSISFSAFVAGLTHAQTSESSGVAPDSIPQLRTAPPDITVPEVAPDPESPETEDQETDPADNPFRAIDPLEKPPASKLDDLSQEDTEDDTLAAENMLKDTGPDYSRLSPSAERTARLDSLFETLAAETDSEDANLIAEEIWAIWLDSGSASVNFILRRGTTAQKAGDQRLARRLYDQVTTLAPEFAEGWSRSGRLALEEEDFSRALTDTTEALIREPRHFYALWTLGNIFEHLGRNDEALDVYSEANRLYPELKAVKDRVEMMRDSVEGDVL